MKRWCSIREGAYWKELLLLADVRISNALKELQKKRLHENKDAYAHEGGHLCGRLTVSVSDHR